MCLQSRGHGLTYASDLQNYGIVYIVDNNINTKTKKYIKTTTKKTEGKKIWNEDREIGVRRRSHM